MRLGSGPWRGKMLGFFGVLFLCQAPLDVAHAICDGGNVSGGGV